MKWTIILLPVFCAALYLLYRGGYMVTQAKKAVMYVESQKGTTASFSFCTGFTRRRIRFGEDKSYHFEFSPELTAGEVTAEILDAGKNTILCLDGRVRSDDLELMRRGRYYLLFRFRSASGRYSLRWE